MRDGRRVKLVAERQTSRPLMRLVARVANPSPSFPDDPLSRLDGTAKGLELETDVLGPISHQQAPDRTRTTRRTRW